MRNRFLMPPGHLSLMTTDLNKTHVMWNMNYDCIPAKFRVEQCVTSETGHRKIPVHFVVFLTFNIIFCHISVFMYER